jgi:hypothetical protein
MAYTIHEITHSTALIPPSFATRPCRSAREKDIHINPKHKPPLIYGPCTNVKPLTDSYTDHTTPLITSVKGTSPQGTDDESHVDAERDNTGGGMFCLERETRPQHHQTNSALPLIATRGSKVWKTMNSVVLSSEIMGCDSSPCHKSCTMVEWMRSSGGTWHL